MKKTMLAGAVLVLALVIGMPGLYAQQQTTAPQGSGWYCPMMSQQAAQGGWYCPMMQAAGQGGSYCPMMNQGAAGNGRMGYGCMMNYNQDQPPAQQ